VYIVPVESDEYRCTPEAKLRVYRTRNGGASWEPLTRGLPQKMPGTILRDSLATDTCDPTGIYFGTRSGKIYGSNDDGKSWQLIHEGLPSVVCVRAALIGAGEKSSSRSHRAATKDKASKSGKISAWKKRPPAKRQAQAGHALRRNNRCP